MPANNPIKYIDPNGWWVSEFDDMQAPGGENPPEVPDCPECDPSVPLMQEVLITTSRPFMKEDVESITTLFRALAEVKEREQAQYEANLAHKETGSCTLANDELNLIPYEKLAAGIFSISKAAAIIVTGIKWGKPVGKVTYAGGKMGVAAYETALAGGKHSGFLKNYMGRSADEINKAIRSMQIGKQGIDVHLDKIANPTKYVPDWNTLRTGHQQSLINGWQNTVTKHTEQIQILKTLLVN